MARGEAAATALYDRVRDAQIAVRNRLAAQIDGRKREASSKPMTAQDLKEQEDDTLEMLRQRLLGDYLQTAAVIGRHVSPRLLSAVWTDPATLTTSLRWTSSGLCRHRRRVVHRGADPQTADPRDAVPSAVPLGLLRREGKSRFL